MKKIMLLLVLIILPSVMGDNFQTNYTVKLTTAWPGGNQSGSVTYNVDGGTGTIKCDGSNFQNTYQIIRDIKCNDLTSDEACESKFNNFSEDFKIFVEAYNQTSKDFFTNCINTKNTNSELAIESQTCKERLANCDTTKNDTDSKWYNLYIQKDSDYKACTNKPEKDCSDYIEKDKNTKYYYAIGGFLGGLAAFYFWTKKETVNNPGKRLPDRAFG